MKEYFTSIIFYQTKFFQSDYSFFFTIYFSHHNLLTQNQLYHFLDERRI